MKTIPLIRQLGVPNHYGSLNLSDEFYEELRLIISESAIKGKYVSFDLSFGCVKSADNSYQLFSGHINIKSDKHE